MYVFEYTEEVQFLANILLWAVGAFILNNLLSKDD